MATGDVDVCQGRSCLLLFLLLVLLRHHERLGVLAVVGVLRRELLRRRPLRAAAKLPGRALGIALPVAHLAASGA
eukprot:7091223-Lingulodinium_polyedra.AAC.1